MRVQLIILIAISSLLTKAHALDPNDISKFKLCAGAKSEYSDKDIQILLQDPRKFPVPGQNFGPFLERMNRINKRGTCPLSEPPHPVLIALTTVVSNTVELINNDLVAQKNLVANGLVCANQWATALKKSPKAHVSTAMFKTQMNRTPSPEDCVDFVNAFVPELEFRFKRMRQYLALSERPIIAGKPLHHDKPFSTFMTEKFFSSVWQPNDVLSGLSASEFKELPALGKTMTSDPLSMYYQVLSTSPILLFFNQGVTPDGIVNAFKGLQRQSSLDLGKFARSPDQDIVLYTPYVLKAIEQMPPSQRGNACLAVKSIYKNLKVQYEEVPRFVNQMALFISVANPEVGAARSVMSSVAARAGVASTVSQGYSALSSLQIYSKGVSMCSSMAMEAVMTPSIDGLCSLETTNKKYLDAQDGVISGAVMGGLLLGASKASGLLLDSLKGF